MYLHACTWSDCKEINESLFESKRHFRVVASTQSAQPEGVPVVTIKTFNFQVEKKHCSGSLVYFLVFFV